MPFLELKNVSKGFGGPPVLSNVNLAIERGEFVAIVGYSGSSKTTLISLVAGLTRPDTGTVQRGQERGAAASRRFANLRASNDDGG